MELNATQKDALTELINIGYARAAAALSDITSHRINLEVPNAAIYKIHELTPILEQFIIGDVVSVNQIFAGSISGCALLLLDKGAALMLNQLLTDRPGATVLDSAGEEVITEVGNIVLNACLGVFANMLHVQVSFAVPSIHIESVARIMNSIIGSNTELQYSLIVHTRFYMRTSNVSGYLVIILGVASLAHLLFELKKWEERQVGTVTPS